ncbi:hypothetical protein FQR65_LT01763 [Abscondita terminalis]|nr:hypothetical protein FQR65_LT01763 [Abscondita terminalis]
MEVNKKEDKALKAVMNVITFLLTSALLVIKAIFYACLPKSYKKRKNFEGEIVLITGGAGGIGKLVALKLAKLKATIVLWDINLQGIEESVKSIQAAGGKAYGYKCDLTDREDVYAVASKVTEEVGQVTILINNAGVVSGTLLLDTPDHLIQRTFDVNILSHFWTTKAFLPKMIEKDHGHIVTIASMAGLVGVHKLVDYCASKFAAVGFDESLRTELAKLGANGIKTTVICPYFIQQTGMFNEIVSNFIPTLKSTDVADKIVEAIELEEVTVIIPKYLWVACIKWILPWSVISLFLRGVVQNAQVPELEHKTISNDGDSVNLKKNGETELIHRRVVTQTCDSCVQAESYCFWCFQEEFKNDRCGPSDYLKRLGCKPDKVIKSDGKSKTLEIVDKEFKGVTDADNIDESIQIRPQKLSVQLSPKEPLNFQFTYRPAEDYPLDLYYLMDLTETMSYDIATMATLGTELAILLQKLSKNFKVAFGYYSDKVATPFSKMTKESILNPCAGAGKVCERGFDFVHRLNFTNDVNEFIKTVNASKTTSNLDNLEGGMDALFQIIVCESHIRWRKNSRKIIVIATDGILHFAGDGILAGAVRRNVDQCLLNENGYYDQSIIYDYPSLGEIYRRLLQYKMNVLFAAKEDAIQYYTKLNRAIPTVTFVGLLEKKSTNVLKLVTDGYFNVVKNVHFFARSDNIRVTFKTNCSKATGWNVSSECDNVEVGKEYVFDVTLEIDSVPENSTETLVIEEKNIAEKLIIDVEFLGKCKCETRDDVDCSGHGVYKCGTCECAEGWKGDNCEINCMNQGVEKCRYKNESYTSSTCYGRGNCDCGKCFCDEGFIGTFCQEKQCITNKYGEVCSGSTNGLCQDGKCECLEGFIGKDCSCTVSNKTCTAPGSNDVCSNAGVCDCGKCKCNPDYGGEYCEICATCTGLCSNYENCVLDTISKIDNSSNCRTEDGIIFFTRLVNTSISVDSSTCYLPRHEKDGGLFICDTQFRYEIKDNAQVELEINENCGKSVQAGAVIGIIVGAVLGIGIMLIIAYKSKLMYADRKEYVRFLEETKQSKMLEENPLYNSPIRMYEMPRELQNLSNSS